MFDKSLSKLRSLVIHQVGNKLKDEELRLSSSDSGLDEPTMSLVWDYISSAFKTPDFYQFTHPVDLEMNNVFEIAKDVFLSPSSFVGKSAQLAKLLYDVSDHPQIKKGDLIVIYFDQLKFGEVQGEAIGVFKSEKKQGFLFTEEKNSIIDLYSYKGISPSKVDKACLIFNQDQEEGFQVLSIDNLNKGEDAKFWFDDFLKLKLRSTQFSQTSELISLTKSFIEQDLQSEVPLDREEQFGLIHKSKEYFDNEEQFDQEEYSLEVFEDAEVADRFREYVKTKDTQGLELNQGFEISAEAVKKKQSVFKSILKLDKNFHIYVHGNREMIERGVDEDGRKFYKLFYEEEN